MNILGKHAIQEAQRMEEFKAKGGCKNLGRHFYPAVNKGSGFRKQCPACGEWIPA